MNLRLRELRESQGISVATMIERLGVKDSRYRKWESQSAAMPLEYAMRCCTILHCTLDELSGRVQMTLTDDSEPQTAEAICINESLSRKAGFPVDCQFAIYLETENTSVMKEAAGKAEALGIYRQMNGRKILLKADVHDLFACFADLYRHCHETYDRFAIEISCSVNSPTAE